MALLVCAALRLTSCWYSVGEQPDLPAGLVPLSGTGSPTPSATVPSAGKKCLCENGARVVLPHSNNSSALRDSVLGMDRHMHLNKGLDQLWRSVVLGLQFTPRL